MLNAGVLVPTFKTGLRGMPLNATKCTTAFAPSLQIYLLWPWDWHVFRDRWRKPVQSLQLPSERAGHVWTAAITWMSVINLAAADLISHHGPSQHFFSCFPMQTRAVYFRPAAYSKGQWSNYFIKLHLSRGRWLILACTLKAEVWSSVASRWPSENSAPTSNWTNAPSERSSEGDTSGHLTLINSAS